MMTLAKMMFFMAILMMIYSFNPVKLSMAILISSSMIFLFMSKMMSSVWFPYIFFMMFMGGILIMFLILSTIMPNEKTMKIKLNKMMFLTFMFIPAWLMNNNYSSLNKMKWFLSTNNSMWMLIMLIMFYFFCFINIYSKEYMMMKSYCRKLNNFVNYKKKTTMNILRKEDKILKITSGSLWDLPSPTSMSYFWNFGSTLGICLIMQILTGFLLTLHYTYFASESFSSIVMIMREVWSGWLLRLIHMNGASIFFFFIYMHLFRGMFFMSATHKSVWVSGVTIMIMLMAISFLGYVLPWGQMSYWAVAVITNLFSVIPVMGQSLVNWIWGGFSVSEPTLTRFYSLHFLLPFILTFLVIMHLYFLHKEGSSNSLGLNSNMDKVEFHPYFSVKDLYFILGIMIMALSISFFLPYILGDSVNNVPANAMQTPVHIQPEWYFLPSYAILRSLPSKTAGVIALALSVSIFYFMSMYKMKFSTKFSYYRYIMFWMMISSFTSLMMMGALPAEEPYVFMSKVWSFMYFMSILTLNM